jgi:hypothetical protein
VAKQSQHAASLVVVVAMATVITVSADVVTGVRRVSAESEESPASPAALSDSARSDAEPADSKKSDTKPARASDFKKELFVGKVVFAQEALKKRGVKVAEEMKSQAVLETKSGELLPIAADWRGRAFYQDKRLRDRKVELVGYRRPGVPYLQVLVIFVIDEKGRRQEMDYWCEICSIPMYEIKACECCQADIDFRLRPGKLPAYLTHSPKKSESNSPLKKGSGPLEGVEKQGTTGRPERVRPLFQRTTKKKPAPSGGKSTK